MSISRGVDGRISHVEIGATEQRLSALALTSKIPSIGYMWQSKGLSFFSRSFSFSCSNQRSTARNRSETDCSISSRRSLVRSFVLVLVLVENENEREKKDKP